ncbi:oxygen-independent coproporphyrinogen III oxidase [Jannaschia ovalis]|uniref:Coproporphyrinogen-III oxidase n=1 Tax=Jannaschia ovalis TaxID=3038773 RepID=A0ABY8L9V1_9RHOB|nr:oxygen-independent coproporphyrinogen III oxidase [Jannaschia sp. GRR-S6-38]WGH78064.1 oxygen-independent coproporphyrinogen III oxidase [Jannaschia sp. GRR-S6-38]
MIDRAFLRRHGLFDARTPRYTSYPPAPHFSRAVGPDRMRDWLGAVPEGSDISLYVHIPFCRRLCWFCACRTQGTLTDAPLRPYLDALKTEIATVADAMPPVRAARLHLGGGTPTILPAPMLRELGAALAERFPLAPGAEVSVELDPTMLDDDRLDALAEMGLNRASIGVQDFAPAVQEAIGRVQTVEQTRAAVDGLRVRSVSRLNLDLLYGLPHQTEASLLRTLEAALALDPDRIAFFGYAHVPWASRRQVMIPADALPSPEARLDLFEAASERLARAGFVALGIDHFAKPDDPLARAASERRLRRNFQGYTDDGAPVLIGLGASAISSLPQGYAQNAPATAAWQAAAGEGRLATLRGHALTASDRLEAAAIEALLCDFAIAPLRIAQRAGVSPSRAGVLVATLAAAVPDLVRLSGSGELRLIDEAKPLARVVAARIDGYRAEAGRHSLAV